MRSRIYTVKLPTDGTTNVDIPVEGPFAAAVGAPSKPTAVGVDGFFAEWRNRSLRCPNKLSLGAAQFVPRFRLGFLLTPAVVDTPGSGTIPTLIAAGSTAVGAGVSALSGVIAPSSATTGLSVWLRIADGVNVGNFDYGPGPEQVAPAGAPFFVTAALISDAGGVQIRFTNNDGANAHTVLWGLMQIGGTSAKPVPVVRCSQSLVGSVLTTAAGVTTNGDGPLADPGGVPSIRVDNGFDVAGQLMRIYLEVMEKQDEDR